MFRRLRFLRAVFVAAGAVAATACASQGGLYRYPAAARIDHRAYDRGYQEGREAGANDARRSRGFGYERHDEFRDADEGYRGTYGDRAEYRRLFREGFVAGYNDGYRQYARDGYGYPRPDNRYPDSPGYGGGRGVYVSPAANTGFRDGYDQGRDDARHGRRFDPIDTKRYRQGDHDYDRRYGARDDYVREYRAAFERGYDRGYREGR